MAELKEEVKSLDELLEQAIERGYVTFEDTLMALPEAEENVAQLNEQGFFVRNSTARFL
jgi:hypothetical protein